MPFFKSGTKVLEIGPLNSPSAYQKIINDQSIEWQTLNLINWTLDDMKNKDRLTIITNDPYHYPVPDNTYDIVISGSVMEHVEDIINWYRELKRIIKQGGYIITILPVSWPYHEAPVDCWRIFPDGFNNIFSTVELKKIICIFDSFEFEACYPSLNKVNFEIIPGRSIYWAKSKTQVNSQLRWNQLMRRIPFFRRFIIPIEVAYDTISIAQK